jgi:hypothetical protein
MTAIIVAAGITAFLAIAARFTGHAGRAPKTADPR